MVIRTDIKPFIIAGFVLVLINSSDGHPLSQQEKDPDSGLQERMALLKKSCTDSHGNTGICMFKWDCISRQGIALTTCVDGFLFQACCSLNNDLQEKRTFSNEFKPTTNYEQMEVNTPSIFSYITLNGIQHMTDLFSSQEEESSETTLLFTSSSEYSETFKKDTTTDVTDGFTLPGSSISTTVTNSNNKSKNFTTYLVYENENGYTNLDKSASDYYTFHINYFENETMIAVNEENFIPVSDSELNLGDIEKSKNNLKNDTVLNSENRNFISYLFNNESHTNNSNKSDVFDNNYTIYSVSPEKGTSTKNFVLDMNVTNTQSSNITSSNDFKTETETIELEPEVKNNNSININIKIKSEQANQMKDVSQPITLIKENEASVMKLIVPSVWGNDTHVLPPALLSVISQLTSRESSLSRPNVDPTMQSNLTSIMSNTSIAGQFEPLSHNKIGDDFKLSLNISGLDTNKKNISTLERLDGVQFHEFLENEQNSDQMYDKHLNSTISVISEVNTSEHSMSNNLHLNTPEIRDRIEEKYSAEINENNELTSDIKVDSKLQNAIDESNYILSTSAQELLNVICNKGNKYSKYCESYYTSSEAEQNNKLSVTTVSEGTSQITEKLYFITDILDLNTISDETQKNENIKEITPISHQRDTTYSHIDQTASTEIYPNTTDNIEDKNMKKVLDMKNNLQTGEQSNVETHKIIDLEVYDSVGNLSENDEFLFDITTDILTYFIKPNDNGPSETAQLNSFSTTNEYIPPTQHTEQNSVSPSHLQTQETYGSTSRYTFNEIVDNLASNYPITSTNSNFNENSLSTLSSSLTFFSTSISNSTIDDESSSEYNTNINNNVTIYNLTLENNTSTENYLYETTVLSELMLNFTVNSSNDSSSSSLTSFESTKFEGKNLTEQTVTFSDLTQKENINLNSTESNKFNLTQNIFITYSETEAIPYVNNSTHTIESNLSTGTLYNSSDNQSVFLNVDIFNDSNVLFNVANTETYSSTSDSSYFQTFTRNLSVYHTTPSSTPKKPTKSSTWNYKKDCGVRPMQAIGRIVGGRNSHFGKWPWQALVKEATWLGLFVKNKCGGVLITSKYVLTAAHCQPGFLASLLVVLGTHDLSNLNDNGIPIIRNVKRMVVHRHYNPQTFENDLALLEMDTELEFMPHIVPICLPHRNEDFTGEMAFVTGWGKLTHGGDVPNILQEVQVPIVANSECQMMFYQAGHQKAIQNNFVCAGYTNGGQDSCEGDSGGPLMVQRKDKRWVLVGTVSHGIGCADPNLPGVYMRMSSYRPWIDSIVNK